MNQWQALILRKAVSWSSSRFSKLLLSLHSPAEKFSSFLFFSLHTSINQTARVALSFVHPSTASSLHHSYPRASSLPSMPFPLALVTPRLHPSINLLVDHDM